MASNRPPNILFIMADDHAAKAISCYGHNINHTPNLDRIAQTGMRFNHCYVTNSICTPSRAAILTGTHNHTNDVLTLNSTINNRLPNVAKHLRSYADYTTGMIGKWHLGETPSSLPTGFDHWSILPGQGSYWDPEFIDPSPSGTGTTTTVNPGYATDIITDKSISFMQNRDKSKPFFLMCHHKAPHRSWECDEKHKDMYSDPIRLPDTFNDDYKTRAQAASIAKMRVSDDLTYFDLGLSQPDGPAHTVGEKMMNVWWFHDRKVPSPTTDAGVCALRPLIDKATGQTFKFSTVTELKEFKFQRYMQRYLRTVQSIDDSVGRLYEELEREGILEDTVVMYTSDQGFFLGEHGWFDKRFMYEESFQMPLLVSYPRMMKPGAGVVCEDIVCNVDFAPTWLGLAGCRVPSYMQGVDFGMLLKGVNEVVEGGVKWEQEVAFHRYWMHNDSIHEAYAHYGIRDRRFKLIYWYNEGFGIEGTGEGGQEREWELFDTEEDPLELFNVVGEGRYKGELKRMLGLLEAKMEEIGDVIVHERGLLPRAREGEVVAGRNLRPNL